MISDLELKKWHSIAKVIPEGRNNLKLDFSLSISDVGDKLQVVYSMVEMVHQKAERYPNPIDNQ